MDGELFLAINYNDSIMKPTLAEIYDEFAKTYDENRGLFDLSAVFESFYQCLDIEQGKLLDLGCGSGEAFSKYFVDRGWDVTGVDFSRQMLKLAERYVPDMKTIHADIVEVEFDAHQFDAIVAIYSLFHVSKDRHIDVFKNIHRWLRDGGKVFFTYATRQYTGNEEFTGHINFLGKELFYSHKTPEKLYADLESVGLSVEQKEFREIGGETFLWVTASK